MLISILQLLHCKWAIPIYIFCYIKCEDGTLIQFTSFSYEQHPCIVAQLFAANALTNSIADIDSKKLFD